MKLWRYHRNKVPISSSLLCYSLLFPRKEPPFLFVLFAFAFGGKYFFARVGVVAEIVHCRGVRHRGRGEVLNLLYMKMLVCRGFVQCFHIVQRAGGVCGDEVGDKLLP